MRLALEHNRRQNKFTEAAWRQAGRKGKEETVRNWKLMAGNRMDEKE